MRADLEGSRALAVSLQGRPIGVIHRLAGDRQLFSFEEEYIADPKRPTLSLSFKGQGGAPVSVPRTYTARVPPFFANLLPEGPLRRYLAALAGVKPEREFFLLAVLGADLPGAVRVTPLGDIDRGLHDAAGPHADVDEAADTVLRFSLAGVQLKFSAIQDAAGGLTIPADGMGGSWIVKLPSMQFPAVPENEFVMLELARAVGIRVPEIRLVSVEKIAGLPRGTGRLEGCALAVRRFDRGPDGERIHMEDFAQIFGLFPDDKYRRRSYANIAAVLWAETGEEGTWEFLRRLVFSVLIGNADMHLKNWSVLYPDARAPILSPAYDFVSTTPYIPDDQLALTFGGSRSLARITRNQLRRFADVAGLPVSPAWEIVRETVERTVEAWRGLSARERMPRDMLLQVEAQMDAVARDTDRQA